MEFARALARVCRAVPLVLLVGAGTAEAAQIALSANGQQLNNLIGRGVALGDFDGDRDLDVMIVAQGTPPGGHVYLNDGKGRFNDVFLACIGPDEVWLNDGRGAFADSMLRLGTAWSWQLAVGDVNRDRLPDVFIVNFTRDTTLPPDRSLVAHPAEVWLNTSRRAPAPAAGPGPAGSPTPAGETRAGRYARDLQQARAAAAAKDYAAALSAYERLIREAPYHPGFHYQIARLTAMTGQPARAADELERALALGYDFGEKQDDAFATLGAQAAAPKIADLIQRSSDITWTPAAWPGSTNSANRASATSSTTWTSLRAATCSSPTRSAGRSTRSGRAARASTSSSDPENSFSPTESPSARMAARSSSPAPTAFTASTSPRRPPAG